MNALEQKLLNTILTDLKASKTKLESFFGNASGIPAEMTKIMADIEKALKLLTPLLEVLDSTVGTLNPELKLVLDWAIKIINALPA